MAIAILNLKESFQLELREALNSKTLSLEGLLREYFNVQKKGIDQKPRSVYLSREIQEHELYRTSKKRVIEEIIQTSENGGDLSMYLSERKNHLIPPDTALSTIGVHHFHLGDKIEKHGKRKGLVKGTKSLLFARVEREAIYIVNIFNHDIQKGFLNREILRIIYRNWKNILEPYHLGREVTGLSREVSDEDFAELLENQIHVPFCMGTDVYFLPGGGLTTGNTDADNELKIQQLIDDLEASEEIIRKNIKTVEKMISAQTCINFHILRFSMKIHNNSFVIENNETGLRFTFMNGDIYPLFEVPNIP